MGELGERRAHRLDRLRPFCLVLCSVFACLAVGALPPVERGPLHTEQHLFFSLILVDLWPFRPDLDVKLDTATLQPGRLVTRDIELRLMARAAVPLCFDMTLGRDVATMIELVQFASPDKGVCPAAFYGRVALYFRLLPEELTTWYGAARLALLQHMQLPAAWSVVRATESCVGPPCARAEAAVAQYATVDPPGQIYTRMPAMWGYGHGVRVPLADIHVLAMPVTFPGMLTGRQLFVDLDATVLRRARWSRIRAKRAYAAGIARYDAALQRQSEVASRLLSAALAREERVARRQAGVRLEYQRYMRARRDEAAGVSQPPPPLLSARRMRRARRQACTRLRRAGATLAQQAVLAGDSRLRRLRLLQRRWRCVVGDAQETSAQMNDVPCETFCDATARLLHWQADTGHTFSLAQMLALFAALHRRQNASAPLMSDDGGEARRLFEYSVAFVERQQYSVCQPFCQAPAQLVAEMRYAVGVLQLLQPDKVSVPSTAAAMSAGRTKGTRRTVGTAVRGVLNLQQAMWAGSRQASAALATLREHGILQRQHSKTAYILLLHALSGLHGDFYHQLLHATVGGTAGAMSASGPREANATMRCAGPSHLQRHLHYFAARHNFDELDHPLLTRDTLRAVWLAEEYSTVGAEEPSASELVRRPALERGDVYHGEGHETRLVMLENTLLKATFMLSELQNNPPDVWGAECRLLTALRRMGYVCDLAPEERAARDLPGSHRLMQICPRHTVALLHVLQNETYPRVRCAPQPTRAAASADAEHQADLVALPSERHYRLLQRALLKLSQVYLLDGVKSGRAARYAALSLRLAYAVYVDTVSDLLRMLNAERATFYLTSPRHSGAHEDEFTEADWVAATRHSSLALLARLSAPTTSQLPAPWRLYQLFGSAERYRAFVKRLVHWLTARSGRLGQHVTLEMAAVPSLAESYFVHPESLVFLALSGLHAAHDSGGATGAALMSSSQLSPLHHVQDTLQDIFNITAPFSPAAMGGGGRLETLQEACTYLVIAAAGMWGSLGIISTLDHTLFVHDTDAIVLLTWLISDPQRYYHRHGGANISNAQRHELQQVVLRRLVAHADDYRALFRVNSLLPAVQDTVESYSARLLRFAQRRVGGSGPIAELLRRGLLTRAEAASPPRQATTYKLDDAPLWPHRLRALRQAQHYYMTRTDFAPLLYLSDLRDHLDASRKTTLEALGERALNALRYLVTETTQEALVRETGLQILRPPSPSVTTTVPEDGGTDARAAPPSSFAAAAGFSVPFVQDFVEDVAALPQLRQFAIAAQLLSAALQSGAPQSFALLLFEVSERENDFLRPMADYLTGQVWGPQTASAWREMHKASQWQRERVRPGRYGIDAGELMTMDLRSPFLSAASEPRQELLARVDRYRASHALRRSRVLSLSGQSQRARRELARAEKILALCSGYLVYMATTTANSSGSSTAASPHVFDDRTLFRRRSFLHSPYDGMLLPAGAASCLVDLYKLREETRTAVQRGSPRHALGTDERVADNDEDLLLRLVKEMTTRQQYYYYLSRKPPRDLLPPSVYALGGTPQDVARDSPGARPPHSDSDEDNDDDVKRDYRVAQLVEPWRRVRHRLPRVALSRGEGVVYNARLHRVTGTYWGAEVLLWWREVRKWVRWLWPRALWA